MEGVVRFGDDVRGVLRQVAEALLGGLELPLGAHQGVDVTPAGDHARLAGDGVDELARGDGHPAVLAVTSPQAHGEVRGAGFGLTAAEGDDGAEVVGMDEGVDALAHHVVGTPAEQFGDGVRAPFTDGLGGGEHHDVGGELRQDLQALGGRAKFVLQVHVIGDVAEDHADPEKALPLHQGMAVDGEPVLCRSRGGEADDDAAAVRVGPQRDGGGEVLGGQRAPVLARHLPGRVGLEGHQELLSRYPEEGDRGVVGLDDDR